VKFTDFENIIELKILKYAKSRFLIKLEIKFEPKM